MLIHVIRPAATDPRDFADLEAFYRADYGVTTSGVDVTDWLPLAGSRAPAFGETTALPNFNDGASAKAIGGLPTISTSFNEWLRETGQATLKGVSGATVFGVWRHAAISTFSVDGYGVFSTSGTALGTWRNGVGTTRYVAWEVREDFATVRRVIGPAPAVGDIFVAIGRLNMASGKERFTVRINGVNYEGSTPTTGAFPNTDGPVYTGYKVWGLGSTNNAIAADTAEMGAYGRFLEDPEVDQLDQILKLRYGLTY